MEKQKKYNDAWIHFCDKHWISLLYYRKQIERKRKIGIIGKIIEIQKN